MLIVNKFISYKETVNILLATVLNVSYLYVT